MEDDFDDNYFRNCLRGLGKLSSGNNFPNCPIQKNLKMLA